jgi:predicted nucleotidyltransferase
MNPLIQEAISITKDLGDVTFLGAVAVLLHTKSGRQSQDLDIAVTTPITDKELEQKGYFKGMEGGVEIRRTPNNYKIDIYHDRPINEIPISVIIKNAIYIPVKNMKIRVVSLEALILMKARTSRDQDIEDLMYISKQKYDKINWEN